MIYLIILVTYLFVGFGIDSLLVLIKRNVLKPNGILSEETSVVTVLVWPIGLLSAIVLRLLTKP